MEREWSSDVLVEFRSEETDRTQPLLPLAHHLCDGVTDDGTRLFDFFFGEAGCDAHLEGGEQDLLGLKVVLKSLQPCDKNAIGEALPTN